MRGVSSSPEWWRSCSGAVTGIGSLPFADPRTAIEFVAEFCPRLPFCPQPPAVNLVEVTLGQFDEPQAGRRTTLQQFATAALAGAFPSALALKTQVTGPITLAGLLGDIRSAERVEALATRVARAAVEQVRTLAVVGLPVLVFVDEPALILAEATEARRLLATIFAAIAAAGAVSGIHCCASVAPGLPGLMGSCAVSFDATADLVPDDDDDLAVLNDARRLLSFGLFAVSGRAEPARAAFSRWLTMVAPVDDPADLARRSLLTASCGLGGSSVAETEAAFEVAAEVSDLVAAVGVGGLPAASAGRPAR